MGLTIHYSLRTSTKAESRAIDLVHQMRQLALDLPLEHVGEIETLEGPQCDPDDDATKADEGLRWLLIQAGQYIPCPWNEHISFPVAPTKVVAFQTIPGPGCEPANIGLCCYPAMIEWKYRPEDDACAADKRNTTGPRTKRSRRVNELRRVRTGLSGWRWSSFCKTQYASNPRRGGLANFLRCHISVIALLDRIAKLQSLTVQIDDEGKYGPSKYSDDWREARADGREPTYVWHPGQYDPKALATEVGDWNEMIAGFSGALKDSGGQWQSAINSFPDFESLEIRGSQDERIGPFLAAMNHLVGLSHACDKSSEVD